jgi:hypothetical protein
MKFNEGTQEVNLRRYLGRSLPRGLCEQFETLNRRVIRSNSTVTSVTAEKGNAGIERMLSAVGRLQ